MLEALIPSKTRVKLLSLFLLNPGREYYVREIARMTEENTNAVRRELANLESFGLITGQKKGNQQYYTVKRDFFLYDDLQKIVIRTEGVARTIRENLPALGRSTACLSMAHSHAMTQAQKATSTSLSLATWMKTGSSLSCTKASRQQTARSTIRSCGAMNLPAGNRTGILS